MIKQSASDFKVTQVDIDKVVPAFSTSIDLKGAFGRGINKESLFYAIIKLHKEAYMGDDAKLLALQDASDPSECLVSA